MKTDIKIISAKHLELYKIEITFSDGKVNFFDCKNIVMREGNKPLFIYRNLKSFKKFKIIDENKIVWGEDDIILPINTVYSRKCLSMAGRKPIADKKVLVRLYINQSVIDLKGGKEAVQEKATIFINSSD